MCGYVYVKVLRPLCLERAFLCHNLPKEEDKEEDPVDLTHAPTTKYKGHKEE